MNYYRDEVNDVVNKNNAPNNKINNNKTITSKSFEYKTKIIGRMIILIMIKIQSIIIY